MSIPHKYGNHRLQTNFFLSSYRASLDCDYEIKLMREGNLGRFDWRVRWAGLCSLLNSSVYLMRHKDAKGCFPDSVKLALIEKWNEIGANREAHPVYWEFIRKERNNILKEYEFAAYEAILDPDGNPRPKPILYMLSQGEMEALVIRGGRYHGQLALNVASEGVQWIQSTVNTCLRNAGFEPDKEIAASEFVRLRDAA